VLKQAETQDKTPKELRKLVLRRWLPVADAMLYMINERLPSPLEAQRLRMRHVYLGDATDQGGQALASCRAEDAPLLVYISKMVPNPGKNAKGSIAFGRIFSGTLKAGDKITVLSNESTPDEPKVEATAVIKSVVKVNATKLDTVAIACAGDVIGLTGLDGALIKCGTLTDSPDAVFAIKSMHFSVSPVVRVAVRTAKASDSSKLQQAMRQLQQQDPIVQVRHVIQREPCILSYSSFCSATSTKPLVKASSQVLESCTLKSVSTPWRQSPAARYDIPQA
jgi:elongation factor 2